MRIGIVGPESAKFTPATRLAACRIIAKLLAPDDAVCVSGHCPLGGVDIWAEKCAAQLGRETLIFPPKKDSWSEGYKPRNIQIAEHSDVVHVLCLARYPDSYKYERFPVCYHCARDAARDHGRDHVKGGGCWTARHAMKLGKPAHWHIIEEPAA